MTTLCIKNGIIEARDEQENVVERGTAGTDDSAVIQALVDRCTAGGEIHLCAGAYRLSRPIGIHVPVTISGEGRGTELIPPPDDFALSVSYDGRCPDRSPANFGVAPAHAEPGITWEKLRDRLGGPQNKLRLQGVHISRLAIQGNGRGKGIFVATLTESTFRDLWIMNTADGAALYLEEEVMECVFDNLHLSNCGSPAREEGTITIRSQRGDACNNLRFRDVYVIFPQYIGIDIGRNGLPSHPRLIWFEHCMIHGWHVLAEPAPYDLVRVVRTDPNRGISFTGCRITNGGPDSTYVRVEAGRVRLEDSVLGGGRGRCLLFAGREAWLQACRNTFHDADDLESVLEVEGASVVFSENQIAVSRGNPILDVRSPASAAVKDNHLAVPADSRFLRLSEDRPASSGPVTVTGNLVVSRDGTSSLQNELAAMVPFTERDNLVRGTVGEE